MSCDESIDILKIVIVFPKPFRIFVPPLNFVKGLYLLLCKSVPYVFGRNSPDDFVWSDVFKYNSSGPNYCTVPDSYSGNDGYTAPNPNIVTDLAKIVVGYHSERDIFFCSSVKSEIRYIRKVHVKSGIGRYPYGRGMMSDSNYHIVGDTTISSDNRFIYDTILR